MAFEDIDLDGDTDLVLGNMGENFYLKANNTNPVKLWIKDFDQNGTADKIFTKTVEGKDIPVFMKREIADQIPSLKKLNLKHHDYASKTIQQLFPNEIQNAKIKQVNYPASCIFLNNGKGNFILKQLPQQLQLSSVNAIKLKDINGDDYVDIIAGGNFFDLLPQFCRLDASYGHVLINDKKGNFSIIPLAKTGLDVSGQTRDIISFKVKHDDFILFLENNEVPSMYKLKVKRESAK